MLWAISRVAAPSFNSLRDQHLKAHQDYLHAHKDIIVISGGTVSDDGATFNGSLLIVNVPGRAEAQTFADNDPFQKVGMIASVKITRMRKGMFNAQAVEGA
jgi:uncharacterized protein YciI